MEIRVQEKRMDLTLSVEENGEVLWRRCGVDGTEYRSQPVVVDTNNGIGFYSKKIGGSGRNHFVYKAHTLEETADGHHLVITLQGDGLEVDLHMHTYRTADAVRCHTVLRNISDEPIGISYVSSFFLQGITPQGEMLFPHNSWCQEVSLRTVDFKELGMDGVGAPQSKRIAVANVGTNSTKEYLPIGYINGMMWQIESGCDWQWELSHQGGQYYIALAGPSEDCGDWYIALQPGQTFDSIPVAVSFGEDLGGCIREMTHYRRAVKGRNRHFDQYPLIFNDYMNCLFADPTTEKEIPVIDVASALGADYYCMDAGWYAVGDWWDSVGEWQPCDERFPDGGIGRVFDYVREKGMKPGVWLEPESMGVSCPLAKVFPDECFFTRHGKRVISKGRYQLDFRHPTVVAHLTRAVEMFINEYGIRYFKFDYNIDAGLGTEQAADSFGDGLIQHHRAYLHWLRGLIATYPDVIFENCSSGGMRLDYGMLTVHPLQSTSDQEDFRHTAVVAANIAVAAVPEQAGIWTYPLEKENIHEIEYNMVNGLAGCMYLSGGMAKLSAEQLAVVREGVAAYRQYACRIGESYPVYPLGFARYDGTWRCVGYVDEARGKQYLLVWKNGTDSNSVTIPVTGTAVRRVFPAAGCDRYTLADGGVTVTVNEPVAAAFYEVDM